MKNDPNEQTKTTAVTSGNIRSFVVPVVGVIFMGFMAYLAHSNWSLILDTVAELGFVGYLLFVVAWVVLASACFPVSVFGFSAGALFGLLLGVAIIFSASMVAAAVMYGLARGVLRRPVAAFIASRPKLVAIDRLAGERALRLNFLTRLSPLNFGLACYTLASGRTRFGDYLVGNLATLPSMFLQVWLGTLAVEAQDGLTGDGEVQRNLWFVGAGLLVAAILVWQILRLVKQALAEVDAESPAE